MKKQIKITDKNREAIQAAIFEAQKRASARTINAYDVLYYVEKIERKMSMLLCKKDWVGITVSLDPHAQKFPAAYKYTPESTQFTIRRRPTGWFLVGVGRNRCGGPNQEYYISGLKQKADLIADYVSKHFD